MSHRLLATIVCLAMVSLAASCTHLLARSVPAPPVAVLGVSSQDVAELEARLADLTSREVEGIRFVSGEIAGRSVVIAWTGVGKVNAAMVATLLIEHFHPAQIMLTGIAGAVDPNLEPGDIVIAKQTAHHDMGSYWSDDIEPGGVRNRLAEGTNPIFFPADPNLLVVAERVAGATRFDPIDHRNGQRLPRVVTGTVVTGDTFIASKDKCAELVEKFEADAVEMEGAAVAQICYQRGIACLVIRSIADKADESAVVDKQKFYALAAKNSAKFVAGILENLGEPRERNAEGVLRAR